MSHLLMCPPDYFGIEYEINPWMRLSNQSNPDRARAQWRHLTQVLQNETGAKLEFMTPIPGLPDLVFTANAGAVHDGTAVPSRFRYPERQQEEQHFMEWFTQHGYDVIPLDQGMFFEGAGDLLGFPDCWVGGYRQRSDIRAYDRLSEIFRNRILAVELVDQRFYHLDTCFCPLSGGELLYYPPAFDAYAQTVIGSTDCMTKAFDTTKRAIVRAYRDQLIQAGHDPSMITIDIVGQPDLSTTQAPEEALQGFDFAVDTLATSCTVAAGAFERGLASGSS